MRLLVAACLALLAACASTPPWQLAPGQHAESFRRRMEYRAGAEFLLTLPAGFDARDRHTRYPLLIFLHGSGESGHDVDRVGIQGPPQVAREHPEFPFIVASPQAPSANGFDPVVLDALLDELLARLPVDPDRVYLTGLSMGGIATYMMASRLPGRFAAIAPVCGEWFADDACSFRSVPVWAFHGALDDVLPPRRDEETVKAINACGGDARITLYPDVGHAAWIPAYSTPELYTWLLSHRRHSATAVAAPAAQR